MQVGAASTAKRTLLAAPYPFCPGFISACLAHKNHLHQPVDGRAYDASGLFSPENWRSAAPEILIQRDMIL
jgi:hypothetical protein